MISSCIMKCVGICRFWCLINTVAIHMPNNTHFYCLFVLSVPFSNIPNNVNNYSNLLDNGLSLYGCRPLCRVSFNFQGFNPFYTHLTKTWVLDKTKNKKGLLKPSGQERSKSLLTFHQDTNYQVSLIFRHCYRCP